MSDNQVEFSLLVRPEFPTRYFAKGDTIFREGERGDEFFVVSVDRSRSGAATVASKLSAGAAFSARWR
jgi:hypothetical protein